MKISKMTVALALLLLSLVLIILFVTFNFTLLVEVISFYLQRVSGLWAVISILSLSFLFIGFSLIREVNFRKEEGGLKVTFKTGKEDFNG